VRGVDEALVALERLCEEIHAKKDEGCLLYALQLDLVDESRSS
jgi:hypothetical protein